MRTQLDTKIRAFTDGWNDRSHPFALTETAGEILNPDPPSLILGSGRWRFGMRDGDRS
jgi:hypothetical protein